MKAASTVIRKFLAVPRWVYATILGVVALFFLILVVIPESICITGLNSLGEAAQYAHTMPELPPMGNTNLVRPDYDSFYRSTTPGYFARKWRAIACCLNLPTRFTWPTSYFNALLGVMLNRFKNYRVERNIVYKMSPSARARLVVIGDLYGAYHSLVRDLKKLKELGILDDSLKIIAPETYIIFMGSTMSRSPYGMETLGLVLRLMEMNADAIIYLRGNHEDNKYWEAFGLKEQYEIKYPQGAEQIVAATNNFFMHLPLGLYITIPGCTNRFIRFSHLAGSESSKLKESSYSHFLEAKQSNIVDKHQIDPNTAHNSKIVVDVAFESEKKRQTFQASTGLRQLPADAGVTTWTLMSAPTLVMQKGLQFTCDAFAIIQLAARRGDWTITEYSQSALKKDGFKTRTYQFFTGAHEDSKQDMPEVTEGLATASETRVEPLLPAKTVEKTAVAQSPKVQAKPDLVKLSNANVAINNNLVHLLAGRRKKRVTTRPSAPPVMATPAPSTPVEPAQKIIVGASTAPQNQPAPAPVLPAPAPTATSTGNSEMSITVGSPTQDAATRTTILPLTITIKDQPAPAPRQIKRQNSDELPLVKIAGA